MSALDAAHPHEQFLEGGLGENEATFLRLAVLASAAHDRFVFQDEALTAQFYEELYRRGGADFAPPAGRLLLVGGQVAGMFAVVPPAALQRSRLIGAVMLARSELLRGDPALVSRLKLAASTVVRPAGTDAYLSRLAVAPAMAGRGLGRRLLEAAIGATRDLGLVRCVLEVADDNERAVALYRTAGFEEIGSRSTRDPETGASLGYLHMARSA